MTDIDSLNLIDIVPSSIADDEQVQHMAAALQGQLDDATGNIAGIELYARIDELPEPILRMLAWEHRVLGMEWQLATTLAAKRGLIRDSFALNRLRGTLWSVSRVFDIVQINASIQEWFQYGGDPYHFKVTLGQGQDLDEETLATAVELVEQYKPLRSVLEDIDLSVVLVDTPVTYMAAANTMSAVLDVYPE